jgi:hypothetical protein
VKLQSSSSDFSVYSTNGEQLAGDLAGYQELAHQIDKKRIVLYVEASDTAILFGTRLMVQIIGGREERAIFIKKYSLSEFSLEKDRVRSFYDEAKVRVENLALIKYRVLGLLKESDIPVQERSVTVSTIAAITGKILVKEPVKIKIEDLPLSFGVATKILESFTQKHIPGYTIAITQYPVDTDILISPNVSGMDLEILTTGAERIQPGFEKNRLFFEALSAVYDQRRTSLRASALRDPDTLSRMLRKSLLDSDILNDIVEKDPKDTTRVILDVYRNDADALHTIVKKILYGNKNVDEVPADIVALVVSHIIESEKNPSPEDREILKQGYHRGNDDQKKKIQHFLILLGIFEDYFLKDLVEFSVKDGDIQLLKSVITSQKFNNKGLQVLKNTVRGTSVEQDQVLKFIELMFASDLDKEPGDKGYKLYLAIIGHYQQQQFNTKKLNHLQDRYGRTRIPPSRQADKKTIVISLLFVIAIIGLVMSVLSHFGLFTAMAAANQTTVNQTIPETGIIQNASNTPVLSITILNGSYFEVDDNQTNGQELNRSISMSNATSVRFIYHTMNETVLKSSIRDNVTLSDIIARLANTT